MDRRIPALIFLVNLTALLVIGNAICAAEEIVKRFASIPSGYSSEQINVKFMEGTEVNNLETLLPPDLQAKVKRISPHFNLGKNKLDNIKSKGESFSGKKLPSLSLWYRIELKPGTDPVDFMDKLMQSGIADAAEPTPLPQPPPAITPDFTGRQGYLGPATKGIDAEYAWSFTGGDGTGVKIYDVEYSWNQTHEDLAKASGVALLLNSGDSAIDPFKSTHHGTAVIGELIATKNTIGVTGISPGAQIGLAPSDTRELGYNTANAIALAAANGKRGDVILIEQQACVCKQECPDNNTQVGLGPTEWDTASFQAIQTAVANGLIVVEAAGNGGVNLDQPLCGGYFDRNVQDSGAIIVGAAIAHGEYERYPENFTSFGGRVDVQGWGRDITTTGYGDLYKKQAHPKDLNYWYTREFGGTSGASPMVAGAAANLQGIAIARGGLLSAAQVRNLLVQTGSPQAGATARHIGPRPNLRLAVNQLSTYSISGTVTTGTGSPLAGVSISLGGSTASPTTRTASDGTYSFTGLASGSYVVTAKLFQVQLCAHLHKCDYQRRRSNGTELHRNQPGALFMPICGPTHLRRKAACREVHRFGHRH